MKILFCFSLLYLLSLSTTAADTLYFVGNIKVSKKISYKYNLRFVINTGNKITGYSLSDPGGANETKTKISGTYDSLNKTISYEETSVLRSKVDMQKNDLCFVKATLKFKKTRLLETLTGNFTGIEPGKVAPCASGEVKLINTDRYKVIMKQIDERSAASDSATKKNIKNSTVKIVNEKGKEFLITGNTIKLTIWDNGQVDEDRISILLNGKFILENYSITSTVKILEISLSDKQIDTIKIIALNEGSLPPNTAAIKIESKFEEYPILTQAKLNEVRTIYLRRKNQP